MLKNLKQKIKIGLYGKPAVDTYSMYSYRVVTVDNEEFKCNMPYYTSLPFKSWVDFCLLDDRSLNVGNGKLINREAVKRIELVSVMDTFTYTRVDSLGAWKGTIVTVDEAEEIRDKNDW